jgi:hypothetical protein
MMMPQSLTRNEAVGIWHEHLELFALTMCNIVLLHSNDSTHGGGTVVHLAWLLSCEPPESQLEF